MSAYATSIDRLVPHGHYLSNMAGTMSTSASDSSDIASYAKKIGYPKSKMSVNLDNHFGNRVYTSGSPVTGNVTIITKRDIRFDSIQILLVGNSKTRVDGVNSPREVTHTFLKMEMPIPESTYPVPRVLETGRTCTIPFNFVIPGYLTMHACNHHMIHERLQDQHVLLPPTMGGDWEKDDMAPQMARVEYVVKARVFRQPDLGGAKIKVVEAMQNIIVLPASSEEPPLNITKHDKLYCLSKSKTLRKNLLSGKLGRLTAEALQPGAAILRPNGLAISSPTAQVSLKFEPVCTDVLPPKVTSVAAKVVAHTYYSAGAIATFPNIGDWNKQFAAERRGEYQTSVSLPSIVLDRTQWSQHLSSAARRDSGYASDGISSPEDEDVRRPSNASGGRKQLRAKRQGSPIYHTTTLSVPLDLSSLVARKMPIPTFHSCITSRAYVLQLTLSLATGTTVNTVTLNLPLQIAVEPTVGSGPAAGDDGLPPSFEEAEADELLRPRLMMVPDGRYLGGSMGLLPGYGNAVAAR